jgi:hypothetical protein
MWIRFSTAAMLAIAAAATAATAGAPANTQDCFALVDELAQIAENKVHDQAALDKVGKLLADLEGQCRAAQMAQAGDTADKLRATLDKM